MAAPRVVFEGVWKKFRRGERHDTLRDLAAASVKNLFGRPRRTDDLEQQEFWAVEDVSFEVKPGEALGIIGPNGAGKSTTLKLLNRILKPTRGRCQVRGRVGALIEVAAGFHPDLTGRENIFLQGTIMGMQRQEIASRLEEIVEFSGVSAFIDTPVKRYSSGMNARLGFSIAAHLDPDVMIIDEVLSVGDMPFQRKCLQRMLDYRAKGVAIVFVSHHLPSIVQLCQTTLLLRRQAIMMGDSTAVVHHYHAMTAEGQNVSSDPNVSIRPSLTDNSGEAVTECQPGTRLTFTVAITATQDIGPHVIPAFLCARLDDDLMVYDANFTPEETGWRGVRAGETVELAYSFICNLTRGSYGVGMHLYDPQTASFIVRSSRLTSVMVHEDRTYSGVADLAAHLHVRHDSARGAVVPSVASHA